MNPSREWLHGFLTGYYNCVYKDNPNKLGLYLAWISLASHDTLVQEYNLVSQTIQQEQRKVI